MHKSEYQLHLFFSFLLNLNDGLSIACSGLVKGRSMSKQFSL